MKLKINNYIYIFLAIIIICGLGFVFINGINSHDNNSANRDKWASSFAHKEYKPAKSINYWSPIDAKSKNMWVEAIKQNGSRYSEYKPTAFQENKKRIIFLCNKKDKPYDNLVTFNKTSGKYEIISFQVIQKDKESSYKIQ